MADTRWASSWPLSRVDMMGLMWKPTYGSINPRHETLMQMTAGR